MIEVTDNMRKAKAAAIALVERLFAEGFDSEKDWNDSLEPFKDMDAVSALVWCRVAADRDAKKAGRVTRFPALGAWNVMAAKDERFMTALKRLHEWKAANQKLEGYTEDDKAISAFALEP